MLRFGLCCLFIKEPIRFRTTTAKALSALTRGEQLEKASAICLHNAQSLLSALEAVNRMGIGAFRVMSPLFPRMTHPVVGYRLDDLPGQIFISETLQQVRRFAEQNQIRLSFHPDQFVVLSSNNPQVVKNSIDELEYHGWLAELIGADVINIHAGGVYGNKDGALERFCHSFALLSDRVTQRLTLENDDISYTVADLLPVCKSLKIPLVYDLHHHRCNPDSLSIEAATQLCAQTWQTVAKEPYCHISSPKDGWQSANCRPHADYIDINDFPDCWLEHNMTIDVEAKAKELAVIHLIKDVALRGSIE